MKYVVMVVLSVFGGDAVTFRQALERLLVMTMDACEKGEILPVLLNERISVMAVHTVQMFHASFVLHLYKIPGHGVVRYKCCQLIQLLVYEVQDVV